MEIKGLDAWLFGQAESYFAEDESLDLFIANPPVDWDTILDACWSVNKGFGVSAFEELYDAIYGSSDVEPSDAEVRALAHSVMSDNYSFGEPGCKLNQLAAAAHDAGWQSAFDDYVSSFDDGE